MKKILLLIIKIVIAGSFIMMLIRSNRLDLSLLKTLKVDINTVLLLAIGTSFVFFGLLLMAWRLQLLLRFKGFTLSYQKVAGITFAGSFLGVLLPGLIGGDALKAIYLCGNVTERRMDAFSSVVIDRLLGLFSLFLLGTSALYIGWIVDLLPFDSKVFMVAPFFVLLACIGGLLFAWDTFFNLPIVQLIFLKLPIIIKNLLLSSRGYLKNFKLIMIITVLSLFNHIFVVNSFIIAAILINDNISILSHFIINPLAMIMNVIPITPGGLGITESTFSYLFQYAGSSNGAIVGLFGRTIQYFVFIITGALALVILKMRSAIFINNYQNESSDNE